MTLRRITDSGHFVSVFDDKNGDYVRTGILNDKGEDTGIDPFQADFPQLLDIGIMGHCDHGLSGLCTSCGVECYQNGSLENRPNMLFEDFKEIISQCEGRTFQVALGGRGDPELHERFDDILACCRYHGIVPNMTTSGYALAKSHVKTIKRHCGAAAVSWYKTPYTYNALNMLIDAGVTTNIHFVLGRNSIDEAISLLTNSKLPKGISRIIFLLHKPVGLGSNDRVLFANDSRIRLFFELLSKPENIEKVGFDSCLVPGIIAHCPDIPPESYDACEAGRFSAYIGSDLSMSPCSFDKSEQYSQSLYDNSISNIWNGEKFVAFRESYKGRCGNCSHFNQCLGGCPIKPEIRLCGLCEK